VEWRGGRLAVRADVLYSRHMGLQFRRNQLLDDVIDGSKVEDGSLTGDDIEDGSILSADLSSVAESKIVYDDKYATVYTPWTDMWLDSNSPPDIATWYGQEVLAFDPSTVEKAGFSVEIPSDAKSGTSLLMRIKWVTTGTGGGVVWRSYYTWANEWASFSSAAYSGAFAGTANTANYLNVAQGSLSLSGVNPRATISMLFERYAGHAADTYSGDAYLMGVGLRYQTDKRGLTS